MDYEKKEVIVTGVEVRRGDVDGDDSPVDELRRRLTKEPWEMKGNDYGSSDWDPNLPDANVDAITINSVESATPISTLR